MKSAQMLLSVGIFLFGATGFSADDYAWVRINAKLAAQRALLKEGVVSTTELRSFLVTSTLTGVPSRKELRYNVSFFRSAQGENLLTTHLTLAVACKLRRIQVTRYGFGTASDCKVESITDNGVGN